MPDSALPFLLTSLSWATYEVWLGLRRRFAGGQARDQGTLGLLWRVLLIGIAGAVALRIGGWGRLPAPWLPVLQWAGCALIVTGLALRIWAVHVLARFFTVDVGIRADHQLVRRGPYRWVRHPSYTGVLLAFYGLGLGQGNVASLVIL
ncbi:MAG TPA: PEMT/PEM2 methyltransferase family protein, partial [Stenotrophomonas sp.]